MDGMALALNIYKAINYGGDSDVYIYNNKQIILVSCSYIRVDFWGYVRFGRGNFRFIPLINGAFG